MIATVSVIMILMNSKSYVGHLGNLWKSVGNLWKAQHRLIKHLLTDRKLELVRTAVETNGNWR